MRMILFAYVVSNNLQMLDLNSVLIVSVFLTRTVTSSCSSLHAEHIEVFMKKG